MAYSSTGNFRQIITGVSDKGSETEIKYWIQHCHIQPRFKLTKEEMVEYFIEHVS